MSSLDGQLSSPIAHIICTSAGSFIDVEGRVVKSVDAAAGLWKNAEFHKKEIMVSRDALECFADDHFTFTGIVEFTCVEKCDAGIIIETAKTLSQHIPTLGVCLGHQAICAAYGAQVTYAKRLMHGKQSMVKFRTDCPLFKGIPEDAPIARYHSLAANPDTMPDCLTVTAVTEDGEIMAVQHREYPIFGVQFHPESILTPDGRQMLTNFINL